MITGVSKGTIRLAGQVAYVGEKRNAYQVLVGRPEGKSSLGRPRHSWEDNIEMNLKKIRWEVWLISFCSGYVKVTGSYEHSYKILGSIKLENSRLAELGEYLV